ncbi:MAG: major capsid protein [Lautropia sp.]|nr:major capsid protein [Lautropia sp.]
MAKKTVQVMKRVHELHDVITGSHEALDRSEIIPKSTGQADALTIAGAVLAAIVAIWALKLARHALSHGVSSVQ